MENATDAVVVGAGPNGLAAAIVLAQSGRSVVVFEAQATPGGGARSAGLTLPGYTHDLASAVHPMAVASPFFATLPLAAHGLSWVHPPAPLAHPFDDGSAAVLERSTTLTGAGLGPDAEAWPALFDPLVEDWWKITRAAIGPLRLPRYPFSLARFGVNALRSATRLVRAKFEGEPARALFGGVAAHSGIPLDRASSAAIGLVLSAAGHAGGWPIPRGGAQRISTALASHLRSLGGEIVTGVEIRSLDELPASPLTFLDLTPRQVLQVAGSRLPDRYRRALARYRYGPGAYKLDWALAEPIPWRSTECARAATLHLGGSFEEIAAAEAAPWRGEVAERPFVLLAQPTLFDPTRAPAGRHTAWAYCHVPNGSTADVTERIEAQIERFAPGFHDLILARHVMPPHELERSNPNLVGGDVNGGSAELSQLFFRPTRRRIPYATPVKGLFLCSSSTPPGGGVHGLCGYFAATAALRSTPVSC